MFKFKRMRYAIPMVATLALVACDDDDPTPTPEPATITATAQATSDLSTLVTALVQADLASALEGAGPFLRRLHRELPRRAGFEVQPAGVEKEQLVCLEIDREPRGRGIGIQPECLAP